MLNAFKEKIKNLSVDPKDQFHTHLRKRVGKRATAVLEKRLKQIIWLMPGVVGRTYDLWSRTKTPIKAKQLGGILLSYMYHPQDFFPEEVYGLFGYLDDAYFAGAVYVNLVEEVKQTGGRVTKFDEELVMDIVRLNKTVKIVIPKEVQKIDQMIHEAVYGNHETYLKMFASLAGPLR